jgi:hypothetical protein
LAFPVIDKPVFDSVTSLKNHLKDGVINTWKLCIGWLSSAELHAYLMGLQENKCPQTIKTAFDNWKKSISSTIETSNVPIDANFFILRSIKQISISNNRYPALYHPINGAIEAVHGRRNCNDLGKAPDGHNQERWASPAFIRFHKIMVNNREQFVPVMTWCKQHGVSTNPPPTCVTNYLRNELGFNESIAGSSLW